MFKRIISLTVSLGLLLQQTLFAYTSSLNLSGYLSPGPNLTVSDRFRPINLRYFSYQPQTNDFKILLDKGDSKDTTDTNLKGSANVLLDYFKIGLSLPNDKFWVNLRPDSEDKIIDETLAKTDLGKVMLEADLKLKQDTALFTSPATPQGKEYWNKLYKRAGELFGTENITIPTLTRPWIVPGEIILRESNDKSSQGAYIYKANLKVMLEEDYLKSSQLSAGQKAAVGLPIAQAAISSQQYTFSDPRLKELNSYSTQLIKELILPKLTQKVNSSKDYANLRQVYFSLILARWFKETFSPQSTLRLRSGQAVHSPQNNDSYIKLIDSNNLTNLTSKQAWDKTAYFNAYQKSFKEGEYNLSEPIYTPTGQVIRRYMSGGTTFEVMPEHSYAIPVVNGISVSSAIMRPVTQVFFTDKELSQKQFIDSKEMALDIFYPINSGFDNLTGYALKFNDILGVNKSFLNEEEKASIDNLLIRIREKREEVNAIRDELKEIPKGAAEPLSSLGAAWKILNRTQAFLIEETKNLLEIINSIQSMLGYDNGRYLDSKKDIPKMIIKDLNGRALLIREINSEKENLSRSLDNMKKPTIVIDAKCLLSYVDGHTNDTNIAIRFNKNGDISLFSKDNTPGQPILKFKLDWDKPKEIETESYFWERKIDDLSPEGAYNLVGAIEDALERANNASSAMEVSIKDEQLQKIVALSRKTDSRIFYLVIDGLGGMPVNGKTELEKAIHPNLDKLSKEASVGLMNITDMPGITPGSGPGHFAIFGYDPYRSIGRGVLDALGAGIELEQGDIIARGNFATLNNEGVVVDRRAGRIKTEDAEEIIKKHLAGIEIEGVKFLFYSTKDHRVALVIRGGDLSAQITDSDPGKEGLAPRSFESKTQQNKGSEQAAVLMNKLTEQINKRLRDNAINPAANTILFRGFDSLQGFPGLESVYKLKPAAICTYPAYKGIAKILGMDILPVSGQAIQNQIDALKSNLSKYDFFYFHVKQTDSAGEDGNFEAKVKKIEEVDALLPQILSMMNLDNGDTLVVTADHSTPARMKAHSWHPVPVLIYSKNSFPVDKLERFTENQAAQGNLGKVIGRHIMPLAMAESGKLDKLDGPISFISSSSLTVEDRNNDIIRNLQKVYNRIAPEYSLIWGDDVQEEVKRHREAFLEIIPKSAVVVDMGTGPGRDAAWFSDHGLQAVGIDFSKEMIAQAQKRHPGLKFQQMDMRRLEFEPNSVDGIWDNGAFHHLPPDAARQAFKEFYRVMKSDGMLFLRVKQGNGEEFQPDKKYPNETRYFKLYQKNELANLAAFQGFEIIKSGTEIDSKKPEQTWVYLFAKKVSSTGLPLTVEDLKKIEWRNVLLDSLREIFEERLRKMDEYHGKMFMMENFWDPFIMARSDKQKIGVIEKAIEAARLYWEAPSETEQANRKELRNFLTKSLDTYCQKILSEIKAAFSGTATAEPKNKKALFLKQINEIQAYYFGKKDPDPDIDYRNALSMPGKLNWAIRIHHKMIQEGVSLTNILEQSVPSTSSAMMSDNLTGKTPGQLAKKVLGGIDFRQMNMLIQPQGSFASSSLDFSLPALSKAEIGSFDLDTELAAIQKMASSGIAPSGERLKEYLAVCFAKERTGKEIDSLKLCLLDIFEKEQLEAKETPDGYKEVLVIADTRGYVLKEGRLAASKQKLYSSN